ncbi:uncharacterized protein LOC109599181 isoform X2 [Aethina tumida]|uniref:uncharacterized protein LOC109599181 isoform X2 n=1 Tax=Aethina tumida TaxID=116153 RepID=UPI00214784CA|nr:uncharacterized protein LOC109599181 isoform X2 [Aethina tumida]
MGSNYKLKQSDNKSSSSVEDGNAEISYARNSDSSCAKTNLFSRYLGPSPDETILTGVQTVLKLCGDFGFKCMNKCQDEVVQTPSGDTSNLQLKIELEHQENLYQMENQSKTKDQNEPKHKNSKSKNSEKNAEKNNDQSKDVASPPEKDGEPNNSKQNEKSIMKSHVHISEDKKVEDNSSKEKVPYSNTVEAGSQNGSDVEPTTSQKAISFYGFNKQSVRNSCPNCCCPSCLNEFGNRTKEKYKNVKNKINKHKQIQKEPLISCECPESIPYCRCQGVCRPVATFEFADNVKVPSKNKFEQQPSKIAKKYSTNCCARCCAEQRNGSNSGSVDGSSTCIYSEAESKSRIHCPPPETSGTVLRERYAITKITDFHNYTTFEVMRATKRKPKVLPESLEGVFVLRHKN